MVVWLAALGAVNLASFLSMGIDKRRARKQAWRVSERALLALAGCFAAFGALVGMRVFHHKTRKPRFRYGVPAMFAAQLAALALIHVYVI